MRLKRDKGSILAVALIFVIIISLISSAIFIFAYQQTSSNYQMIDKTKALYACEAAMQYALALARKGISPHNTSYTVTNTAGATVKVVDIEVYPDDYDFANPADPSINAEISCIVSN